MEERKYLFMLSMAIALYGLGYQNKVLCVKRSLSDKS